MRGSQVIRIRPGCVSAPHRGRTFQAALTWFALGAATLMAPPLARSGTAQSMDGDDAAIMDLAISRGDSLHFAHQPAAALATFDSVLAREPEHVGALWRAARESVELGILSHGTDVENAWYFKGEEYARRAVALRPNDPEITQWLLATVGQRAVQTNAATAARLGTEIYRTAHAMLRVDPGNAAARHALGVLNYEVMKLTSVERFIGSRILGHRIFRLTSWDDAVRYLQETVDMLPRCVWCRIDLAKLHIEMENAEAARREFEHALTLPAVHPSDAEFHRQAQRYLDRLP